MAYFETWVADCRLGHVARDGESRCQAAIWADSHDAAMVLLAEHLAPEGYRILWVDECLPAGEGAKAISGAHAGRPVVLGPLLHRDAQESGGYLVIDVIRDAVPLGAQTGVPHRKAVPDALREPLFGQPDPTAAEIAHYGGADRVPRMQTYAILDAAKIFGLPEMLEASGLECRCLFMGDAAADYREVAPYLVALEEDNPFTTILFTHLPGQPENMTTLHMWHKEPGIYVRSRFRFDLVWKHFRKFTRIYSKATDSWRYFRFYEPSVVSTMVASFSPDAFEKFGAVAHAFASWPRAGMATCITRRVSDVPLAPVEPENDEYAEIF